MLTENYRRHRAVIAIVSTGVAISSIAPSRHRRHVCRLRPSPPPSSPPSASSSAPPSFVAVVITAIIADGAIVSHRRRQRRRH